MYPCSDCISPDSALPAADDDDEEEEEDEEDGAEEDPVSAADELAGAGVGRGGKGLHSDYI